LRAALAAERVRGPAHRDRQATMVECQHCVHFRKLPGDTVWKRRTGCYHPQNMEQTQSDFALKAQEIPGDHEKLNLRGDCPLYEARRRRGSLLSRLLAAMKE